MSEDVGNGAGKKLCRIFPVGLKLEAIRCAESSTVELAAKQFGVRPSKIGEWQKFKEKFEILKAKMENGKVKKSAPAPVPVPSPLPATPPHSTSPPPNFIEKKARRYFTADFKLRALKFANVSTIEQSAKYFGIKPKTLRNWQKRKEKLDLINGDTEELVNNFDNFFVNENFVLGRGLIKRPELDKQLLIYITEEKSKGVKVSRRMIREKARELSSTLNPEKSFTASCGWVDHFTKRYGLTLRQQNSFNRNDQTSIYESVVDFIIEVSKVRLTENITNDNIVVMDERFFWIDMVKKKILVSGSKRVRLAGPDHKKSHAVAMLTAKGDGTKLRPYVIFKKAEDRRRRKEEEEKIEALQAESPVAIGTTKSGWLDNELTKDWMNRVYGKFRMSRRLLIWDNHRNHVSVACQNYLRKFNTTVVEVSGNCTKNILPSDVSWNKPFSAHLQYCYDAWLAGTENKKYTKKGKLKAPSKELVLNWIEAAWDSVPVAVILNSFKICGITANTDGSEDLKIHGMKTRALRQMLEERRNGYGDLFVADETDIQENQVVIEDADPQSNMDGQLVTIRFIAPTGEGEDENVNNAVVMTAAEIEAVTNSVTEASNMESIPCEPIIIQVIPETVELKKQIPDNLKTRLRPSPKKKVRSDIM